MDRITSYNVCYTKLLRVWLGENHPTVLIGERINPSGRKAMAADIKNGDLTVVKREALNQVQAGAEVLDSYNFV